MVMNTLQNSGLLSFIMWLNIEDWSDINDLHNFDEIIAIYHKKLNDIYNFPRKHPIQARYSSILLQKYGQLIIY